jgi:hypothetical protein
LRRNTDGKSQNKSERDENFCSIHKRFRNCKTKLQQTRCPANARKYQMKISKPICYYFIKSAGTRSDKVMQNIEYLKDQNAVLVPVEQWEKLQNELARLKKRLRKAEILTDFKNSFSKLKTDLRDEKYDAKRELAADDFIAKLKDE